MLINYHAKFEAKFTRHIENHQPYMFEKKKLDRLRIKQTTKTFTSIAEISKIYILHIKEISFFFPYCTLYSLRTVDP